MSALTTDPAAARPDPTTSVLDVVIPVLDEQEQLAASVTRVVEHLRTLPWPFTVTVADNASTDATPEIAATLAATLPEVRVLRLAQKGRGRALRRAWTSSGGAVLVYMDVDLSTDLNALLPLVAPLISGHSDLAIGSRLARGSHTVRGPRREVISRGYNLIVRSMLGARFSDAQCGFKAIRVDAARALLPLVEDDGWFFDTELLVVAERAGLRIHEVPVDWVDDPGSTVHVWRTAVEDLRGIARVGGSLLRSSLPLREVGLRLGRLSEDAGRGALRSQVGVFMAVGICSTLAYGVLFWLLRLTVPALLANLAALVLTAVGNTAANRRFTFGVGGPDRALRDHAGGLTVLAVGLVLTSAALTALDATSSPGPTAEVVVLTAVNLGVTMVRFVALRWWLRRP